MSNFDAIQRGGGSSQARGAWEAGCGGSSRAIDDEENKQEVECEEK